MATKVIISESLLKSIVTKNVPRQFSLEMDEWIEPRLRSDQASWPLTAACKPSPTLKRTLPAEPSPSPKRTKVDVGPSKRFLEVTDQELQELSKPFVPKKTSDQTKWALQNFHSWMENRNSRPEAEKCPEDLLLQMEPNLLKKWLSVFVAETRKVNGEPYPPLTLQSILSGLLRYMRGADAQKAPNIFAKKDPRFEKLHNTMDTIYRALRAQGVGAEKQSAEPFSKEEENLLWTSGVFRTDDPVALQHAVFIYNGKGFCLRGGSEHRSLALSQLKRVEDGYVCIENSSKNRAGGIAQLKLKNKTVKIVANSDAGERCHDYLLDKYISHLPDKAKEEDLFYVRPLDKVRDAIWYSGVPIGRNKLSRMVQDMCNKAGIKGHNTNHSLRATGATHLYSAGVPEKIIQERTGHRSLECLRMYEQTSDCQHKAVSKILSSKEETTFNGQLQNIKQQTSAISNHVQSTSCIPTMNFNSCSVNINYNINQGSSTAQVSGSSFQQATSDLK